MTAFKPSMSVTSASSNWVNGLRILVLASAVVAVSILAAARSVSAEETCHVWQKVEIVLKTKREYANPYEDVDVWVELEGPDFRRRCYGFGDWGGVVRVRICATAPGTWNWRTGSNQDDPGLRGRSGSFRPCHGRRVVGPETAMSSMNGCVKIGGRLHPAYRKTF